MSCTIIYHMVPMILPPAVTGHSEPLVLIAAQMGCSRTYESGARNARRVRDWDALHFGTAEEVLADVIGLAGEFEGGIIKLDHGRGDVSPETYIGRGKRLIKKAAENDFSKGPVRFKEGTVYPRFVERKPDGSRGDEILWEDRDGVASFVARYRAEEVKRSAHYYFRVRGPEVR